MIVGLVGKSCSGKDTVCSLFGEEFSVVDADLIGHEALQKKIDEIRTEFGEGVIKNGSVDRKALSKIVFSSPEKLKALDDITHPWIKDEILRECKKIEEEGRIAVINGALLEEAGLIEYVDEVLLVISPYEKREERALKRDNISVDDFKKRTEAQSKIGSTLYSSGKKVITIINDKEIEELSRQVSLWCAKMKKVREK